uniref:Uncharacterized protein n=1 Tax=Kalanchoe fedtschenkoi TaxID=63787 RepID=A0A7N0U5Q2_KALFE
MAAQAPPLAGSIVSASTQASTSSGQVIVRAPPFKSSFLSYGELSLMEVGFRCVGGAGQLRVLRKGWG